MCTTVHLFYREIMDEREVIVLSSVSEDSAVTNTESQTESIANGAECRLSEEVMVDLTRSDDSGSETVWTDVQVVTKKPR